jgi:predicted alpha/beta hydrolase family esterase
MSSDRAATPSTVAPRGGAASSSSTACPARARTTGRTWLAERLRAAGDRVAYPDLPRADGVRLVCSDADPYCPEGAGTLYGAPLGIPVDLIPGRGHINLDAGYGPWRSVEAWCRTGDGPITAR